MTDDRHPVYRRRRTLVVGLVAWLADQPEPVPWDDVLHAFRSDGTSWRTLENTIRDLVAFGALHIIGRARARGGADTRALVATPLGLAWLEGRPVPLPGEHDLEADLEDRLEEADEIADRLADDLLAEITIENPLDP